MEDPRTNPEAFLFVGPSGLVHIDRWAWFDWSDAHADGLADAELDLASGCVAAHFCDRLAEGLGPPHRVLVAGTLRLVTALDDRKAKMLLALAKETVARIRTILPKVHAQSGIEGGRTLMHFADADRYYDWISDIDSREGELPASGGSYLGVGMTALYGSDMFNLEPTIAHETMHDLLDGLDLPVWIEEGLAQLIEEAMGYPTFFDPVELLPEQQACWRKHGLAGFWSGEEWRHPDERNRMSYALSLFLMRRITSEFRKRMQSFILEACRDDAGEAAAAKLLGTSLGRLAGGYLGPGDWAPESN